MKLLLDAFWRAVAYCLHPRVIALSLLPLVLMVAAALALGYFFWDAAIDAVNAALDGWSLVNALFAWLDRFGLAGLKSGLAPLVIVFLATPVIVIVALLAVAALMTPAMLGLVARRRFPALERKHGGSLLAGSLGALLATLVALLVLVVSIPLWLVPPLALVIPPLVWGWLAYRVLSYDVLAEHASREERLALIGTHRWPLLGIGVLTGYLGAAPSLVWASGVLFVALAPVLVPAAIWIYTLVFAFAALWFAHYCLAALQAQRDAAPGLLPPLNPLPAVPAALLPPP
ncbi:MAG: EI24 domain-containing protein [Piscinibacter sp.]|nr:EI24 domain-containing protein [Piscinibacter sp.]